VIDILRKKKVKRGTLPRKTSYSDKRSLREIKDIKKAIDVISRLGRKTGHISATLRLLQSKRRMLERAIDRRKILGDAHKASSSLKQKPRTTTTTTKGEKISRGWRFIKAIKKNYSSDPDVSALSVKEIRSEYKKFREGRDSQVPDVIWQNPSP